MKIFHVLLAVAAVAGSASPAIADTTPINFGTPSGNLGNSHVYTVGEMSVVASGFNQYNRASALYGKNAGGDEIGLGLANDPSGDHEIYFGKGFVQLDVSALIGKVSDIAFFTNSLTQGEQWSVFGSNTSGSHSGLALLSGTSSATTSLPELGSWHYYDFVSTSRSGGKNFLIGGLSLTSAVPEPATWAMLLLGFLGIGATMRSNRTRAKPATHFS